ncbi:putative xenobiotic-transporting ATPase [Rosa chinensis]|uniref:ABC-type xenobiotic transporter n=1 Tax=Rosa chinensis TaxID=74649 RepID=A0A2P6QBR3_ROSCH|nr:putative xenobiotic-transporting ATPase [Rosa chinensis]
MELFHSSMHLLLHHSSFMSPGTDFLLKPLFIRGFSGSLHLLLLFVLLISWLWKKFKVGDGGGAPKEGSRNRTTLYYRHTLICCLVVFVVSVGFCLFNYFSWYKHVWYEEKLVTLFDLAIRTLSWGVVFVYLHTHSSSCDEPKFPFLLRVWWGFYFSLSCYCLVIDIVLYQKHIALPVQSLVSDAAFLVSALFFIYVVFIGTKKGRDTLLEEPLLNGSRNSSIGNTTESNKSKGDATVKTPYSNAGIFSILTFSWMSPLIAVGNKKTLDLEDVPQLDKGDSVVGSFPVFRNKLESECGTLSRLTTLHLVKALIFSAWREILWIAFFVLLYTMTSYVGPYLIDTLVQYLNGRREFEYEGYALVFAFLVAKLVECHSQRHWFFRAQQIGVRIRAVLVAMIYNKGLTLSCQSKQCHTSGEIINFMTVDAERVGDFAWYMHEPWMVVLQVALALLILYKNLGLAAIATFVAIIIVMLANVPLGKLQEKFQEKLMESMDRRMKATSEILRNMRILKLQAWEMKFFSKIIDLRKTETGWLRKFVYTAAMNKFVFWVAPTFVSVVTFLACMLLGIPLESGKILSALATFRILQQPIFNLPDSISMIAQTKVSLDRIASFLSLDELKPDVIENLPRGSSDTAIEILDANFSWELSSPNPTLKDINLKVSHGMKVAVCGTVGSGKSSLLSCILGEVPKISGTLKLCGTKAYVSQSPWIQSGKIEQNILFGKEMDRERYEGVLEACSLKKDLEILSFGDQTVIGERGINLSGGQKQRIQIARALYQDADIYLFDDPLSAVDAHTGSHLFKECLMGLLSFKTVIYVTHQVEFLPAADIILVRNFVVFFL